MNKNLHKLYAAKDWVFDLDNTLYPQECALFPQIQVKMNRYVADFLGLPLDEARAIQKKYYVEHGTTLNGLMLHHDIDPYDYLHHVHDIDYSILKPDPRLRDAINALPARKTIFTNGSRKHAENALAALGLEGIFHDLIDIAATDFKPKPEKSAFETLIKTHDINPQSAVMVEDLSKNLVTAHEMGFMTLLVWSHHDWDDEPEGHKPAGLEDTQKEHIHFNTDNLGGFIENVIKQGKE